MPFSLSAKPPKAKPKKAKDKVVVRSSGRGGSGNIKRKKVPPTPPSGADLLSLASGTVISPSPAPLTDATSSQLSRIASGITHTSKSGSYNSADMGEAEDRIKAPVGREILSAKHRKIYSGRGGAGNAHKLLADDSVYERVLLHEQGIVQAYKEERKSREGRSTGRGGHGNIRKKKSALGSDTSSTRTRSSGRSWGSITRRHRSGHGTNTQSSLSLSPIPSLQALPNNDFGSPLDKGIFERGIFERVDEEDDARHSSEANIQAGSSSGMDHRQAIKVVVSRDTDMTAPSSAANIPSSPLLSSPPAPTRQPFFSRTPASKPISPSAISSGSWIANRLQEATSISALSFGRPSNTPPPRTYSSNSSSSSVAGRGKSVPPNSRLSYNATPSPLSSSPPVLNITISPSTTPTSSAMNMRRVASTNALSSTMEMSEDQVATIRPRQAATMSNQANRNVSVYKSHDSMSSSASDDALALYRAYSQESLNSNLPYLNASSSTPRAPSNIRHPVAQRAPSRPLPSSPSPARTLELPHGANDATIRHSRHMSSSDTSGSDLDLSRYNFPDAPGHEPRVLPRETTPLHMIVNAGNGETMMVRRPLEPVNAPISHSQRPPPTRTASRAPVQPGAYQAALRSVMDDVPDGPPPLYQPRTSRRYHVDQSQDQDYPEPLTPTSYSPHRVASPSETPMRIPLDTSAATLRPNPRPTAPASPLSEVHTPTDGSPVERYPSETRMNEKSYSSEKPFSNLHRSGSGRRPSDPYHRLLAAAAKNSPPNTPPRRGSSSHVSQQTLSPHMAANHHSFNADHVDSPTDYSASDSRSRPPSQSFSTYTRGTRHSTWGASQATATAVDHHDADFPHMEEDDETFYSAMFGDVDGYENERGRAYREALIAKSMRFNGKERDWLHPNFTGPPLPQMPKHLLAAKHSAILEPATSRSPSRQLPTPPIGPTATPPPTGPVHPVFPGGMGWDELDRPLPRKLSKMEKALLRRVEFGAVAAADIASIPLA